MTAADAREPLGTPRPPRLPEGFRIGGWEIGAVIGSGGWGTVYAARTVADGTPVAVKVLPTDALAPGQRTALGELIDREVRFSSEADHPHLIRTRAVCTVDAPAHLPALDGAVALVMDLAEGSLKDVLDTAVTGSPLADADRVLRGTAAGLAHMHGAKWVHGDLKPANVLLGANGQVWLADFGLAAELDGSHAHLPPLGTLDHLPPEWWSQRTGPRGTLVRPTADIWAFGVLAHQVLTGGLHPFPGATARARSLAAQAYARGTAPLRLDAGLDEGWRRLIADCLAPDHASRLPHTAETLTTRIEELTGGTHHHRRRGRPAPATAAALAALAAAVTTGTVLLHGGLDDGRPRTPAPAVTTTRTTAPGDIPPDSDVPEALRPVIAQAARRCTDEEITPAFLAALLKAESGFDANASRPSTDEYGIAMWTPSVFRAWAVDGDGDGDKDHMSPPDAIATMSGYTCWLGQRFKEAGMPAKDLPALIAAGYRTSDRTVIEQGGVPDRVRHHVDEVLRYHAAYTG
ncbi:serine/threonine-protein kinase [Streptomyces somaliensis DSM 40738]|uniref:Serine/threonine protein kinase n=1 Tax=Streptomyces somaliensis (strain ATCC 33201 / DSM 40738 / JCM 12659 / KCTC 9044 / NCTC 11332 / NRRL B-12077 / IP 733) TaxID=1134445 RepID=A0AA44DDF4_STRE0|nr:serine/threonine-protein kinase [Streptomyces somaliensis]MCQ0021809.1 serine/threonine-protein kinase [Streptomyces somaliensis DSM 40738]NKY14217.1 serine/threonine protein kinase [Streptomyces somaliensis DSM 40738]